MWGDEEGVPGATEIQGLSLGEGLAGGTPLHVQPWKARMGMHHSDLKKGDTFRASNVVVAEMCIL